ncbi:MAG: hypothetical protein ACI9OJ_000378 [Myxococcota bacterium]|jgi:hypothetical protein
MNAFGSLGILTSMMFPLSAAAQGDEGTGATIDQHHSELRASLQQTLGDAYDATVDGVGNADTNAGVVAVCGAP